MKKFQTQSGKSFTSRVVRKSKVTNSRKSNFTDAHRATLAKSMNHSVPTADAYYDLACVKDSVLKTVANDAILRLKRKSTILSDALTEGTEVSLSSGDLYTSTPTKKKRSIVSTGQNVNDASSPLVCDSSVIPGIENVHGPMVHHPNGAAHKSVVDNIRVTRLESVDESKSMEVKIHESVRKDVNNTKSDSEDVTDNANVTSNDSIVDTDYTSVTECESIRLSVIDGVNLTHSVSAEQHSHVPNDEGISATVNVTLNESVPRCMNVTVSQSVNACKTINVGYPLSAAKATAVTERDKELCDETIKTLRYIRKCMLAILFRRNL